MSLGDRDVYTGRRKGTQHSPSAFEFCWNSSLGNLEARAINDSCVANFYSCTARTRPRVSACTRSDMRALYLRPSVITIDWFDVWFHTRDILVRDLDRGTVPAAVISRQVVYSCMHTARERERERALLRLYSRLESASPHDTLYLHNLAGLEARWDARKTRGISFSRGQSHGETNCKRILISSNVKHKKKIAKVQEEWRRNEKIPASS